MEKQKKNDSGITLVALVVSIIVMLVLAGVSLNATVGENGIVTRAQDATLMSKFSQYMEEFNINKVGAMIDSEIYEDFIVNIKGTDSEFLKYVPSVKQDEREDFEIIGGYLIYKGKDENARRAALAVGMKDEYDQVVYDTIGKEFAYYVESFYKAVDDGTITEAQYNAWKTRDTLGMNYFREYAKIPLNKYDGEFELQFGALAYLGTDDNRLALLASSSYLKDYIATEKFLLPNYVAPIDGGDITKKDDFYYVSDWVVDVTVTNGAIMTGTIIGYQGETTNFTTISIPDTIQGTLNGENKIINITSIKGDGTNNIFNSNNPNTKNTVTVQKVVVAKGIKSITKKGLANLGANVQVHIMYIGSDLTLGDDKSNTNIVGYEGIQNACGSFTFVASETGNYTFKLWGASGGNGSSDYSSTRGSECGVGGYSEGKVSLLAGENIYCYIGGKGLYGSTNMEDGSGGYNGGGSGLRANGFYGYAGGGETDIRYGGTKVTQYDEDYRILVAGGGGGSDNGPSGVRGNGASSNDDGAGGYGGGTVNTNKSSWSGNKGAVDGYLTLIRYKTGINRAAIDLVETRWYNQYFDKENDDGEVVPAIDICAVAGGWKNDSTPTGAIYYQDGSRNVAKFFGQPSSVRGPVDGTLYDHAGGGAGYYGGEDSLHNNGGGAGGSAYADLIGTIKQVTEIRGYSGNENGDGAEMLGKYGNGKIIISK